MSLGRRKPELEIVGGDRVILRGSLYTKMRRELCTLAEWKCEECGKRTPLDVGHADHIHGRGAGKRDDRIFVNGKRNLQWMCPGCHSGKHVPAKVVPAKPSDAELREILGLSEAQQ